MLGTAPENAYAVSGYDFNFEYDSPTKFIIKDNDTAESSYSNAWGPNYSDKFRHRLGVLRVFFQHRGV